MNGPPTRTDAAAADPHSASLVADCAGWPSAGGVPVLDAAGAELLSEFNRAGVTAPVDVHAALRLAGLAGEHDPTVVLAAALAVRAPRVGHVVVDLLSVRRSVVVDSAGDVDLTALPWPAPVGWLGRVAASPLVGSGGAATVRRPLVLDGGLLYLERHWRDEVEVADELLRRAGLPPQGTVPRQAELLDGLFDTGEQREAARAALTGGICVIAGGPGTGKTTTVARLLALVYGADPSRPPLVALTAPTGKAAARMEEAVQAEIARTTLIGDRARSALSGLTASTIHRLLGSRPDRPAAFRHDRHQRLPHDIVIVDEASMLSLSLMARLLEALRPSARLILVGDPEQLVSVEAGAVLADVVAAGAGAGRGDDTPTEPEPVDTPGSVDAPGPAAGDERVPARPTALAGRVRLLSANHRFAGSLAELAAAVRAGDAVRALAVLGRGDDSVAWVDADPSLLIGQLDPGPGDDEPPSAARVLSGHLRGWASEVVEAATAGELGAAVTAFSGHRLLCAHRHGPAGVAVWNTAVEALSGRDPFAGAWYAGRPVLVTANDYGLRLFNGDTGVTVALPPAPEGSGAAPAAAPPAVGHRQVPVLRVAFGDGRRLIGPSRLDAVETVFAMTVHKSQGSEYDQVTFVVPGADSQLLTRELLYTALTRARRRVLVVGTADSVERAVTRPVARASGLTERIRRG